MTAAEIGELFEGLSTPHVADACLRSGLEVRCTPPGVHALDRSIRAAGLVRPVRHYGSVDIFLEALEQSSPGEIMVIDNAGRQDEACVGDLIVLECKLAALAGMVIWGLHRDAPELLEIGLPVFSLGACPTGPLRLDPRDPEALVSARIGGWIVDAADVAIGDANGALFVPAARAEEVATLARSIRDTERAQSDRMRAGTPLRAQLRFSDYLVRRSGNPALTFRDHLRRTGGAIEE
jgi:regulator of RNase E activity RraA